MTMVIPSEPLGFRLASPNNLTTNSREFRLTPTPTPTLRRVQSKVRLVRRGQYDNALTYLYMVTPSGAERGTVDCVGREAEVEVSRGCPYFPTCTSAARRIFLPLFSPPPTSSYPTDNVASNGPQNFSAIDDTVVASLIFRFSLAVTKSHNIGY